VRPKAVGRSDSDHAVGIAGVRDAEGCVGVERAIFRREALVAEVSGSDYDNDAAVNDALAFVANWRASAGEVAHVVRIARLTKVGSVHCHVSIRSFK
jgi:hypothetical protein